MSKLQIAAIVILRLIVTVIIPYSVGIFNEFQATDAANSTHLSPARNLEGTWKTIFSVTFYIKTDFETGELHDIGSENFAMTWKITRASDENVVNDEVSFAVSNQ